MKLRTTLSVVAIATASALSYNLASASDVTSGATIVYGRAGGLVGTERVQHLSAGKAPLSVSYDRDIAARTGMATDRATGKPMSVYYDEGYAARTNMSKGKAARVAGSPANKASN